MTIGRALTLVVALLSAATPLMRAYCQLTCGARPDDRQVSVASRGQACHDATGDALAPATGDCGHHGEAPIMAGALTIERQAGFTADQDVLLTPAIGDVVAAGHVHGRQPPASPPERPRRQPDALRI